MDIGSRIKAVRKALGLNQTEFGNKLAVSQSTIAGYEVGCRLPPDAILRLICVTYNVDYKWLRDGEGYSPFVEHEDEESRIDQLMAGQSETAKIIMAEALRVLDDHAWQKIGEMIQSVARRLDEKKERE